MERETQLENFKAKIVEFKLSKNTESLINQFYKEMSIAGASYNTRYNYLKCLRTFLRYTEKPLESMQKEDIINYLDYMRGRYTEGTINLHKQAIRKIYKYMNGGEEFPNLVKWIKIKKSKCKVLDESELLTPEEIKRMIDVTVSERYKSVIACLYESGCRINELLSLKIKNLIFDEYGAVMTVDGKTGKRRIRLVSSVPYIKQWLNNHPFKNDPESYVWLSMARGRIGTKMHDSTVLLLLKRRAKIAGIKKRVFCHLFRHSRLTELAKKGLTEFELKVFAGWEMDSSMAKVYVRMTDRDVGNKILELSGKLPERKKMRSVLEIKKCPKCNVENTATSKFCLRCGLPIDQESIKEFNLRQNFDRIMDKASGDPRMEKVLVLLEDIMSKSPYSEYP